MKKTVEDEAENKVLIFGFNEDAYLEANPDVQDAIENGQFRDATHHLETFGLNEIENGQRKFHNDFEPFNEAVYLATFEEVENLIKKEEFSSCFEHFCLHGYDEIKNGSRIWKTNSHYNIVYDIAHIDEEKIETLREQFEKEFYLENNPDLNNSNMDPFEHYMILGWKEGRLPNAWFNTKKYLETNIDIRDSGMNPFEHYILYGKNEGRNLDNEQKENFIEFDETIYIEQTISEANAFDDNYYLGQLTEDEKFFDGRLLEHYINIGWKKGYNPNSWFNVNRYLFIHNDVKENDVEPLSHYLLYGKDENRDIDLTEGSLPFYPFTQLAVENIPRLFGPEEDNKYIEYEENDLFKSRIKTIAFYLPQFHPFPENDQWWGKGFTEWANVTKAKPNFVGHYQPHLPIHNGFYDLRVEEVMVEQARLAKNYGIYGFNYYYYWFDGKILMDLPLKNMLKNKKIDIPFCLTWANENWTRRWDGAEHDVLMAQNHSEKDSRAFIQNLFEYFRDERYITIDKKPVLIIYRANIIPKIKKMAKIWRAEAVKMGFKGLYIVSSQTFGATTPDEFGFDASIEFPPHTSNSNEISDQLEFINPEYEGNVFNYETVVKTSVTKPEPDYDLYRTLMLGWDNTARKQNDSHTFTNFTTYKFQQWFSHTVNDIHNNTKYKNKLVFINAWNEWAEGTHLEPDREFGYASLNALHNVLKQYDKKILNKIYPKKIIKKRRDIAVLLHLHYTDMWEEIITYLDNFGDNKFDLYISITNTEEEIVDRILAVYPKANIFLFDNRGRDIFPMIKIMKQIINFEYSAVCKIHSKKSLYRDDGTKIKDELFNAVLGTRSVVEEMINTFKTDKDIGLIINEKYNIKHTEWNMRYNKDICVVLENIFNVDFEESSFPAGSMYWFRPEALKQICNIESKHIPLEEGWSDGTVMHAIERFIGILVTSNNYKIIETKVNI